MDRHADLVFIVNEQSRNGHRFLDSLYPSMKRYRLSFEIYKTTHAHHAAELAASLAPSLSQTTKLVVVGGDGTLNEVITGLESIGSTLPIAYIPTGSGNDFARSQGLSLTIEQSLQKLIHLDNVQDLDILKIENDHQIYYALNSFGIGVDGMVNYKLEQSKNKKRLGNLSYFATILSAYFAQKPFSLNVVCNQQSFSFPDVLLAVCVNHKFFGGGIPIHPGADPSDGLMEIVLAEKISFFELIHILAKVLYNQSHLSHPKLHSFQTPSSKLEWFSAQYGQTDGEWIEVQGSYKVTIKKRPFWI